jgi:hypothetical protein
MNKLVLNKFDDIQHVPLKVYNRVVFLTNLHEDAGVEAAREYVNMFTDDERKQMYIMQAAVKTEGLKKIKEIVTKGVEFSHEGYAIE